MKPSLTCDCCDLGERVFRHVPVPMDYLTIRYFLLGALCHAEIDVCFCSWRCVCRIVLVGVAATIVAEYERKYEQ